MKGHFRQTKSSGATVLQADDQKDNNRQAPRLQQDIQIESECSLIGSDNVQSVHDNDENREENENSNLVDTASAASTNKYEFMSEKHINGYMEEPKAVNFTIQELFLGSTISDTGVSTDDDFPGNDLEAEAVHIEETEEAVDNFDTEEEVSLEKRGQLTFTVHDLQEFAEDDDDPVENFSIGNVTEKPKLGKLLAESELSEMDTLHPEIRFLGKHESLDELDSFSESYSSPSDAKPESIGSIDSSPARDDDVDSITYELSEGTEDKEENNTIPNGESVAFSDDEFIELEPHTQNSIHSDPNALSGEDSDHKQVKEDLKETNSVSDQDDDQNDFGFQWDHDDLIEQLKLELRNVRTGGLPTILEEGEEGQEVEESESPMVTQDLKLKPLKIDVKVDYKDRIEEIQKVHRSYAEKMRKLDILNNQTMHAIGFLQLKDHQVKSIIVQKPLIPIIVKNLWPRKAQGAVAMDDPMLEFCSKLNKELELVYVGQACLSWEILHWQKRKLQELQQCDAQGFHRYNLVASEFQLFQVLMHRFIENESFQGPRVQNYVRNRCVLRSLLHVPAIRDDSRRDKRYGMEEEKDAISMEKLAKILAEAMHTFWEFLRKDETNTNPKAAQQTLVEPADSRLLIDVKKDFQKKEKKLKDVQRSGNCVVRKFQKQQDQDRLEHEMLVAQVEIRLISRVLNMSKLTSDQLMWCHQKLNHLNFDNRKLHLEPSFLLFPC
ncbi:hypothetical protein FNV43_RR26190 [Rhamnella rubrinervis]|uniref:Uncharacterized protein n=1 Tax=Rhamnella rubrinervis TaxID=2594499 RepID=A0A8K0DNL4_9ROSA|nr:hypothetical protein FNV43_RR26190 [Rhamnella rubrinervis]